ncbi:MAG: ComF family protein [Deltaproteobacteria bacterium]|nr:ComF family protein [Deltaproteobacteria bacterium]
MKDLVLDLIFPKFCQGCRLEGIYLCLPCQNKIRNPPELCPVCKRPSLLGQVHPDCGSSSMALKALMVAAEYEQESIRSLVWHLKYNYVKDIAQILALLLADYLIKRDLLNYFASAAVIPVPLHKRRLRLRGFNQAELVAQDLAKLTGLEYTPILQRTKNTKSQVDLPREERLKNLEGAFSAAPAPSLGERKIILIDDVSTTGATLNECAKVLRRQSVAEIWGLVVARN